LDAERAIAWRAADSFALREFLGLVLPEAPPDHSTISRTRRLVDLETHEAVFTWMLQRLADAGLVKGKTVGIDATTLEAALRSIRALLLPLPIDPREMRPWFPLLSPAVWRPRSLERARRW
jgi:hypothetical protein